MLKYEPQIRFYTPLIKKVYVLNLDPLKGRVIEKRPERVLQLVLKGVPVYHRLGWVFWVIPISWLLAAMEHHSLPVPVTTVKNSAITGLKTSIAAIVNALLPAPMPTGDGIVKKIPLKMHCSIR